MILLDTHAVIWLAAGHRRSRPLERAARLNVSPATLLELQFLVEAGRVRLLAGHTLETIIADERWRIDEPPPGDWFLAASAFTWTRDPFDRLILGHADVRRWKLATADEAMLSRLPASKVVAL